VTNLEGRGTGVILVTRLNGSIVYLNAELVKAVDVTPDAVITLTTGEKVVARESAQVIVDRIIDYQRKVRDHSNNGNSGE
jgi:flagellar protein FlbD